MISDIFKSLAGGAIAFVLLYGLAFASDAVDCAKLREKIRQHGSAAVETWALANGYSPEKISRIRKACGV